LLWYSAFLVEKKRKESGKGKKGEGNKRRNGIRTCRGKENESGLRKIELGE